MAKEVKRSIRERIWRLMEERDIASFPRPVYGRIPNFKGAERACQNLTRLGQFADAAVVKINPDAPQRPCREAALAAGKTVVMPTPRIREGFLLLDPRSIPREAYREASTIAGAFKWGRPVKPWHLPGVDLVVVGSVAVNPRTGRRVGKSHGYAEIEWGILTAFGKAGEGTPVATTVHDVQLVEDDIPREPFDLPVDVVATPTKTIFVRRADPKPSGIYWEYVTEDMLREIPLLSEIRRKNVFI
ncbi:5-formyltetrahydrofolate cyclo-ligase [Pyrobaculum neutrophilum]|uniref:5-formyltetrahydrofolate cyclo-ligase n=1 Tax=Pyrobaculum neutrophilum (strain DSM 2338 / JCM 9278 / NBRC 100436 / V24Sta) TaxID=444157 RepID=B1YBJ5_PYRNV|nr:5-formyltetrahydrofolate cyclo-ligase [Pyrobaculum neutrophilum]ACB40797.1 5-formyltetrahydrofolate cyclo-ligase [Pyrobaculum neutrophilum V24Sta]